MCLHRPGVSCLSSTQPCSTFSTSRTSHFVLQPPLAPSSGLYLLHFPASSPPICLFSPFNKKPPVLLERAASIWALFLSRSAMKLIENHDTACGARSGHRQMASSDGVLGGALAPGASSTQRLWGEWWGSVGFFWVTRILIVGVVMEISGDSVVSVKWCFQKNHRESNPSEMAAGPSQPG